MISVVVVLVLIAVGATAWVISSNLHGKTGNQQANKATNSTSSSPSAAASVVLTPASITTFDPYGSGDENTQLAKQALAGDSSSPWHTNFYLGYSNFGRLKPGTGLILDMGKDVSLSSVSVQFGTSCCTSFKVMIGNDNTQATSTMSTFTTVATSTKGDGVTTVPISSTATGRYVLIWLTNLPPLASSSSKFEAFVSQITLHGTAARSSG